MRFTLFFVLILLTAACVSAGSAWAQPVGVAQQHHPWGSFRPGAWKQVRVETEMFDEKGVLTGRSTTETETTLLAVDKEGVTLQVCGIVEVAGKRFETEPETFKQGFHGELANHGLEIKELEAASVTIGGRKIPSQVLQLEFSAPTNKTLTTIYYSATVAPYVLRRDSITTDSEGQATLSRTIVAVRELSMPWKVLAETKPSSIVRTIHEHPKGTIITWAFTSTEVPGGVICHTSKELDKNHRQVRRSTLQLTDYGLEPDEERTGVFGRKRVSRVRKPR